MESLVVNAFGGPGAGKTTAAWNIAADLKKKGYVVEYVPEYAKELVWEGNTELLNGSIINQAHLLREQNHRIERLIGKAEIIITDSPLLLNLIYLKEMNPAYEKEVLELHNKYSNFNFIVERGDSFEKEGRIHSLEESKEKDKEINSFLNNKSIYYGVYTHANINILVDNIIKNYKTINKHNLEELMINNFVDFFEDHTQAKLDMFSYVSKMTSSIQEKWNRFYEERENSFTDNEIIAMFDWIDYHEQFKNDLYNYVFKENKGEIEDIYNVLMEQAQPDKSLLQKVEETVDRSVKKQIEEPER